MATRRANLGREITAAQLADRLGFKGSKAARRKRAREWMVKLGIALCHTPGGRWFTTMAKLRSVATAEHVWQQFVAEGYRPQED